MRLEVSQLTVQSNLLVIEAMASSSDAASDVTALLEGRWPESSERFTTFFPAPANLTVVLPESEDQEEPPTWRLPGIVDDRCALLSVFPTPNRQRRPRIEFAPI